MQEKNYSHSSIVYNYFNAKDDEREHYNEGTRIFFEGDTLYSFGRHFPLATKCKNGYLLNGDTYSPTTSGHQGLTRRLKGEDIELVVDKETRDFDQVSGEKEWNGKATALISICFEMDIDVIHRKDWCPGNGGEGSEVLEKKPAWMPDELWSNIVTSVIEELDRWEWEE